MSMQNDDDLPDVKIAGKIGETPFWLVDAKIVFTDLEAAKQLYPILTGQEDIEEPIPPLPLEQIKRNMRKDFLSLLVLHSVESDDPAELPSAERLIAALEAPREEVRVAAIEALGKRTDESALDALLQALYDPSLAVRQAAATVLADAKNPRVIRPLALALADDLLALRLFRESTAEQKPDLSKTLDIAKKKRGC